MIPVQNERLGDSATAPEPKPSRFVAAVEKERMMDTRAWKARVEVVKVLNRARDLARSGQYPDHRSIIAQLEPLDEAARNRLQNFRQQLDRMCVLARPGQRFDIPGR